MSDLFIRKASELDVFFLFHLRNHSMAREQSHNTNEISYIEHDKWFKKTISDNSTKIFIAQEEDALVGMVRFDIINGINLMSWAVCPEFQGKGFGKEMVFMASKTVNSLISAEIKQNNYASIKIAEDLGMDLVKTVGKTLFYQK